MRKVGIALLGLLALSAAALWLTGYVMAKDGATVESPRPVSQTSYKAATAGREAAELAVFAPDTPRSAVPLPKYEDFDGPWPNDWQRVALGREAYWGKNFCVPWDNTHNAYSSAWDGWPARDGPEGYPSHTNEICSHNAFASYPAYFESWLIYGPFTTVGATAGQIQFRVMMDTDDPFAVIAQTGSTDCTDLSGYNGLVVRLEPYRLWRAFYVDFGDFPYVGSILDEANVCLAIGFLNRDNTSVNSGMFLDDISIWAAGLPTPTPTPTPTNGIIGDVNGDGDVTIVDLVLMAQFLGGVIGPADLDLANADVNGDGDVTIVDLVLMAQFLGGVIPGLPPA